MAEKITCRESLNSSGTVSRKTSTASDYTPEHTVSHDSRPTFIDQTNVSFSTESCMSVTEQKSKHTPNITDADDTDALLRNELNDSLKQKDVKLVPGAKVDLKVFILQQQEPVVEKSSPVVETETTEVVDSDKDKTNESQLKVPQRKISRFLVSPVLSGKLDVPKDKETDNVEAEVEVQRKNSLPSETPPKLEHEKTPEVSDTAATTTTTEAPVLGPEMITLEQLKISLDNLKNSSHPTHKKETNDEVKKSTSAADVTTTVAPKPTVTATSQPILTTQQTVPFVSIPTTTIYQNAAAAAITIQPVAVIQPTTTTVPQTVPIVQHTQAYQQPVASVPPLLPAQPVASAPPLIMQYVAAQPPPPPVVTSSVPLAVVAPVTVAATIKPEEVVKPPQQETKKILENLRHVADR